MTAKITITAVLSAPEVGCGVDIESGGIEGEEVTVSATGIVVVLADGS